MRRGNRCPNASLPGAIYCGLPTHQALKRFKNPHVAILDGLPEDDIAKLAGEAPDGEVAALVAEVEARAAEVVPAEEPAAEEPAAEEVVADEPAAEEPASQELNGAEVVETEAEVVEATEEEPETSEPEGEPEDAVPEPEAQEEGADGEVAAAADEQEDS
jgi:N utilization substance protein A